MSISTPYNPLFSDKVWVQSDLFQADKSEIVAPVTVYHVVGRLGFVAGPDIHVFDTYAPTLSWLEEIDRTFGGLPGPKGMYWVLLIGHLGLLIGAIFGWWREQ